MDGALPTFGLRDFTAWTGSTLHLYHFKVPTEIAVLQIIYRKYGNSTACVLMYNRQSKTAII